MSKYCWSAYETIGISIINPRGVMTDPFDKIRFKIQDFCYEHSERSQMREYIGKILIQYPEFAHRIKNEILRICPQYKELIDKLIVLV